MQLRQQNCWITEIKKNTMHSL